MNLWSRVSPSARAGWSLTLVLCIGLGLAANGLWDESLYALDGDMPRYLMNGAFLHDLIVDAPLTAPFEYAQQYYARYPALSLGHHPFVAAIAEVPFFALFGISVTAARLSSLVAFAVALVVWFRLIQDIYDTPTATFASLLFITSPGVVPLFQVVLSEPTTLCFILLSVYFMHRYGRTSHRRDAGFFVVSVILSAYAKHLAVLMFPVYVLQFVQAFGVKRLFEKFTLSMAAVIGVALLPLIALTLKYSQFNIALVTTVINIADRTTNNSLQRFAPVLLRGQFALTVPLLAVAALSIVGAVARRDRRIGMFLVWIGSVFVGVLAIGLTNDRFFCYWLPAFAAVAAAVLHVGRTPQWRLAWSVVLTVIIGYQAVIGSREIDPTSNRSIASIRPAGATGYEQAAQYVVDHPHGDAVLYSAAIDTGYFVFFVRKHDEDRRLVVLRADKTLTTSRMRRLDFNRLIESPDEILPILRRYGVGYVVIEEREYPDGPLRWLQRIVQQDGDEFALRSQIPVGSRDIRLAQAHLSVYEVKNATTAAPDAALSIEVPLMNDRIQVRMSDLARPR